MSSQAPKKAVSKPPKCPVCKAATVEQYRPFCSKRCCDIDLGRWLTGSYAIAGGNADADEDGDPATAPAPSREADSD